MFTSDKICRSYSDLNFGITFFGTQCKCRRIKSAMLSNHTLLLQHLYISCDFTLAITFLRLLKAGDQGQEKQQFSNWVNRTVTVKTSSCYVR